MFQCNLEKYIYIYTSILSYIYTVSMLLARRQIYSSYNEKHSFKLCQTQYVVLFM
jgi:hypothetical protein